jgi:hypothetical protein
VIALDTNLLVYAHRKDAPFNDAAFACMQQLAQERKTFAIPWPCVHEFLAVVTHARIYNPPSTLHQALDQIDAWRQLSNLVLLSETAEYWDGLKQLLASASIRGPKVHDARIAALCQHHGVTELWSCDRDFSRFPSLRVRNPL